MNTLRVTGNVELGNEFFSMDPELILRALGSYSTIPSGEGSVRLTVNNVTQDRREHVLGFLQGCGIEGDAETVFSVPARRKQAGRVI